MPIHAGATPFRAAKRGLALVIALSLFTACDDDGGNGQNADASNDAGPEDLAEDTSGDGTVTPDGSDGGRNCTPGTRRCIAEETSEVCSDNSEWEVIACTENQLCWGGECGDVGTCEPESVEECLSFTRYRGCNPVGTGSGEFDVPFNLTCISDGEGNRLVPRLCLQGESRCDGEQVLERCAESGLEYEFSTNCFEDDETTLCDDGQCITLCEYIEKQDTYVGCEYWALDLDNAFESGGGGIPNDAFHAQFAVAITNPGETLAADITIRTIDEVLATGTIDPGHMQVFELPYAEIEGTMRGFWGYRIISTVPIAAYQFNPLENEGVFSNDASILFPTSSLGTEYYVMTRHQIAENFRAYVTIVATQEGSTDVTIRLPEYTDMNPVVTLAGGTIPPMRGGDEYTTTLQQYEALNIETGKNGADLTGTFVESTRPVAVFGGVEAGSAPTSEACIYRERQEDWVCAFDRETSCFNENTGEPTIDMCFAFWTCCADHLEHQIPPISTWGTQFNAGRSVPRCPVAGCAEEPDVWRIMAGADNTEITLVGIDSEDPREPIRTSWTGDMALDAGEFVELSSWSDFEILSTGPVFVGQFLVGLHNPGPGSPPANNDMNGDPTFIMVPPREQYRNDYIFLVPAEYAHNFVTIVAPAGTSITHTDEQGLTETYEAEQFTAFGSGAYGVLRVELPNEGYQRLTSVLEEGQQERVRFGVIAYGYDDDVSYGYAAGLDLKEINR